MKHLEGRKSKEKREKKINKYIYTNTSSGARAMHGFGAEVHYTLGKLNWYGDILTVEVFRFSRLSRGEVLQNNPVFLGGLVLAALHGKGAI